MVSYIQKRTTIIVGDTNKIQLECVKKIAGLTESQHIPVFNPSLHLMFHSDYSIHDSYLSNDGTNLYNAIIQMNNTVHYEGIKLFTQTMKKYGYFEKVKTHEELKEGQNNFENRNYKYYQLDNEFIRAEFHRITSDKATALICFYVMLIISKNSPDILAINNVGNYLSPSVCRLLIPDLHRLAGICGKTILILTQSPPLLDGIDTTSSNIQLIRAYRDTQNNDIRAKIIKHNAQPQDLKYIPLSISFMQNQL